MHSRPDQVEILAVREVSHAHVFRYASPLHSHHQPAGVYVCEWLLVGGRGKWAPESKLPREASGWRRHHPRSAFSQRRADGQGEGISWHRLNPG